ncbi:hypothetical protein D3C87_1745440 [compost metagenome]
MHRNPSIFQESGKFIQPVGLSILKICLRDGIVFNDIYTCRNAFGKFPKLFGILQSVVEIVENNIFESNAVTRLLIEVVQRLGQIVK